MNYKYLFSAKQGSWLHERVGEELVVARVACDLGMRAGNPFNNHGESGANSELLLELLVEC